MQKSLPSYKHIKDKYKNGQELTPVEIGRGIVFLLIEELADDTLPNHFLPDNTIQDSGEFYIAMLQNLSELSKQHLDTYDMVYYINVMVCCIRCLVYESSYCIEKLASNINYYDYARQKGEHINFIDKAISMTDDKNTCKALKEIKNNYLKTIPLLKNEIDYKNSLQAILLQLSAIYKFSEIISLNWQIPELARLFCSSTRKMNYNTWVKSALGEVNKYIFTEPKISLSEIKIQPDNAKTISQLLEGRYLDISRIDAFIKTLKEGTGIIISGGV